MEITLFLTLMLAGEIDYVKSKADLGTFNQAVYVSVYYYNEFLIKEQLYTDLGIIE